MGRMRDLRDFYSPNLTATINGTEFTVDAPTAREGFALRARLADPELAAKVSEVDTINMLFKGDPLPEEPDAYPTGGLWDKLNDAGVSWPEALHLGITAIYYYGISEEAAVEWWESAGKAEQPETKKTPARRKPRKSNS